MYKTMTPKYPRSFTRRDALICAFLTITAKVMVVFYEYLLFSPLMIPFVYVPPMHKQNSDYITFMNNRPDGFCCFVQMAFLFVLHYHFNIIQVSFILPLSPHFSSSHMLSFSFPLPFSFSFILFPPLSLFIYHSMFIFPTLS